MNILVTGAKGFIGRNLVAALRNIKDGKDGTHPQVTIDEVFETDIETTQSELQLFASRADFVFNLAGVNRPQNIEEFQAGNCVFADTLLTALKAQGNTCPVMLASSVQASLEGRFCGSEYGKSKRMGEELFFEYGKATSASVFVFRFPNVFGKWCKPNYNSAVATFCYNTANDLPITVNDRSTELELLYIDDLVTEMIGLLENKAHRCEYDGVNAVAAANGKYCYVPVTHKVTLGAIADLLQVFHEQPNTLVMPEMAPNCFEKKLFSTYLSYLPACKVKQSLAMHEDARGSFTELVKTSSHGQFSVNVSKPGVTKGEHWHHTKWEMFIVVAGHARIRERKIGSDEVIEFEVDGAKPEVVYMLPGYTHNITNLSQTENLVTLMWVNEAFDASHPDTFREKVAQE